jgi:hypothetical protein
MNELHDRINRVINTLALEACLEKNGKDLIEFQFSWHKLSQGDFSKLPKEYQDAILAGEAELQATGPVDLAEKQATVCA